MPTRKNRSAYRPRLALSLWLCTGLAFAAATLTSEKTFDFETSKGLTVRIVQDPALPFIHAELHIYYDSDSVDKLTPTIAYLALLNVFSRELNDPPHPLMRLLRELGNDFDVEQQPDFLGLRVNFLNDKIQLFIQMLKELFNFDSFSLRVFNASKQFYWPHLFAQSDWEKQLAYRIAYRQLFPNQALGQSLVMSEQMAGINLAQIRSFCKKTFRSDRSLLLLRGNINPHITLGSIERNMQYAFKKLPPLPEPSVPVAVNQRRLIIINDRKADLPYLYWFDTLPAANNPDYFSFLVASHIIFGYPTGRIYQGGKSQFFLGTNRIASEVTQHRQISVSCISLRLNYADIEDFIQLVDSEWRKLNVLTIQRREYLDAVKYFLGKKQVESSEFAAPPGIEIGNQILKSDATPKMALSDMIQKVSLERIQRVASDAYAGRQRDSSRERGIIVLVGNAETILANLKTLKPEAVEKIPD